MSIATHRDNETVGDDLSQSLEELEQSYLHAGRAADAQALAGERVEVDGRRVKLNPADSNAKVDLAASLTNLGDSLETDLNVDTAIRTFEEALAIARALTAADPSAVNLGLRAGISARIGTALDRRGRHLEAVRYYTDARDDVRAPALKDPDHPSVKDLPIIEAALSSIRMKAGLRP